MMHRKIAGIPFNRLLIFGSIIVAFVLVAVLVNGFFTPLNLSNMIWQVAPIGIMACGVSFVMITGGIDISAPAVMAVSAVIGCSYMAQTGNLVFGTVLIIAIAGAFGLVNGFATAHLGMVPLVVTLSMMTICQGIATSIAGGESILGLSPAFSIFFDKTRVIIIFVILAFLLDVLLRRTVFGRRLYYIGTNKNTSLVSGIPTKSTIMLAYVTSGLCAGVAGVFNTAALSTARAAMGPETQILDVISAAVIGGVSIRGGKGTILGATLGAILIIVVNNVMNLQGVSDYYTNMVKGSIIIIAMAFNAISHRFAEV